MDDIPIGIDLGTTNTVASYYSNGQITVLEPREGGRLTPSCGLYETSGKWLIGKHAKRIAERVPRFGIYEMKRLIGRKFDDPNVTKSLKYFSFAVEPDDNNDPVITIDKSELKIKTTPQSQSALILKKIGKDIKQKFGKQIKKAVITVPAYFNISQRQATLDAAKQAGFEVLKLLNEPTAAALDYFYNNHSEVGDHFMVFDLGGGTFDVAVLKKNRDNVDVISVDGDSALGGHDIDNLIMEWVCDYLKVNYNYSPTGDGRQLARLRTECVSVKEILSFKKETKIILEAIVPSTKEVLIPLTRKELENMADPLFVAMMDIVDSSLKNSELTKSDIKSVILVGGSTRIPKISEMLINYFKRNILSKIVNPDESVAKGAALQAAIILQPDGNYNTVTIRDVVPLSIGISNSMAAMTFIIKRNTSIPHRAETNHVNLYPNKTSALFKLFEGERVNCKYNRPLGELTLTGITPSPPGQCRFVVELQIDQNGILQIKAKEKGKNNEKILKIDYHKGTKIEREVSNALKDAEDHKEDDKKFAIFAKKGKYLKQYCIFIKYNFETMSLKSQHKAIYDLCVRVLLRFDELTMNNIEEVEMLIEKIEGKSNHLAQKHNFQFRPLKTFWTDANVDSLSEMSHLSIFEID